MSPSALPPGSGVNLLQTYAEDVSSAVKIITSYCSPAPSFNPHVPNITIPSTAPLAVQHARQKLVATAAAIQSLATEPADYLPHLAIHYQHLACLHWLCHFDILRHIPDEPISFAELAKMIGVPEPQLRSVIRMIITSNFLCEPSPNHVAHNEVSALFITNSGLMDWANFMTQYSAPAAAAFADATEKWDVTDRKDQTAFNIATNSNGTLFDYFARSSELANCFASYMKSVQASQGTSLEHHLTGFDRAGLGEALVVDVGGSTCSSSLALAEAFPKLSFVVEDLPNTISNSSALSTHPARSRIRTQPYDFFTPQPVHGADVYLLRMILHDWPSADAIAILQNQLPALRAHPNKAARLIIMDTVLPRPGSISRVEEALLRVRDLTMMQSFNSKERELGEFEDLFSRAGDEDGCLKLRYIVKPPGSVMSVMEVVYQLYGDQRNGG